MGKTFLDRVKKGWPYVLAGFIIILATALIYFVFNLSDTFKDIYSNTTQLVVSFVAGLSLISIYFSDNNNRKVNTIWLFVGLGFVCWSLGQGIWMYHYFTFGESPYIFWNDAFFLISKLFVIFGLFLQTKRYGKLVLPPTSLILLLALFTAGYFYLTFNTLLEPNAFYVVLQALYILGDITLVVWSSLVAWTTREGIVAIPWTLFAIAFVIYSLSNTFFDFLSNLGVYLAGGWPDLGWISSFVIVWIGANIYRLIFKEE